MNEKMCEIVGENLVVHLPEELDHHSSRDLDRQMEQALRGRRIRRLVFDYSRTKFMDSAGVGAILVQYKRMQNREAEVTVYGVSGRVRRLLDMAGIPRLVRICATAEEAMREEGMKNGR